MKTANKDKKTYTVNEYTTIVDKIIAEKLPVTDALVKMLEIFGNCKVINMDKGGKRGKGLVSHCSPSTANVHLMGKGGGVKVRSNPTQTPSNEGALPSANVRLKK